jgi:AcrR family transcriptional regulator
MSECSGEPKLDPRVRRTRKLLEDALRTLLAKRPYDEISVGDIADLATVNRATFYAHYLDKRDLTANLIKGDFHEALLASLPERGPLNGASLARVATAVFEFVSRTFGGCPKAADEFAPLVGPTLQQAIEVFIRSWLNHEPNGLKAFPGSDKETVASVVAWSLYGSAVNWSHNSRRPPVDKAVQELVALLLRTSSNPLADRSRDGDLRARPVGA